MAGEIRAAVPVNEFAKHVASLHADGDIGFSREYEAIQNESIDDLPCEHSQHPENKRKNRYLNITACKLVIYEYQIRNFTFKSYLYKYSLQTITVACICIPHRDKRRIWTTSMPISLMAIRNRVPSSVRRDHCQTPSIAFGA